MITYANQFKISGQLDNTMRIVCQVMDHETKDIIETATIYMSIDNAAALAETIETVIVNVAEVLEKQKENSN